MASGAIDSLHIEIEASSTKAAQQINNLAKSLDNLKKSVESVNVDHLKKELGKLGRSEYNKIEKLSKALQGLKGVRLNPNLGNAIMNIASAMEQLQQRHINKLTRFGEALKNMKGAKTSIGNMLPAQILNLAAAMDQITDDTIMRISRLTIALGRLRGIDLKGVGSVMAEQRRAAKEAAVKAKEDVAQEVQEETQKSGNNLFKDFKAIDWSWSFNKNVEKVIDKVKEIGVAFSSGVNPYIKLAVSLVGGLASAIGKIAVGILKTVFNIFKKIASVVAEAVKAVGRFAMSMLKLTPKLFGIDKIIDGFKKLREVLDTFKRIAFYRLVRSAIKAITDTLKEGSENAYWYSRNIGNDTRYISEAMDAMSSASYRMGNQLGAAWDTLLATIQPIIMQIINLITRAMEVITQFFAVLGGKSTYLKARDYTKAWADETQKGNKAAKEWKNQLLGFDEINRLDEPSDNNSGGGGGGGGDFGEMFEEVPVDSWFSNLKKMLESGNWAKIGTMLGDKFNDLVKGFNWRGWGLKIGEAIQKGIDFAYNFLKSEGFRNLGRGIVELLDSIGDQIDFNTLGRLVVRIRTALWDVLVGAVAQLGQADNAKQLAMRMSDYIIGALQELADWIRSLPADEIARAIKGFFGNIKYVEIRDAFVLLVKTAWDKAIELKDLIWDDATKTRVTEAVNNFFNGLNWETIRETIKTAISTAWKWATARFDEIWPPDDREAFIKMVGNALTKILKSIIDAIDVESLWTGFKNKLKKTLFGIGDDSGAVYGKGLLDWFSGNVVTIGGKAIGDLVRAIYPEIKGVEGAGEDTAEGFLGGFKRKWGSGEPDLVKNFKKLTDDVKLELNIASPSRVFESIGENVVQGFFNGFKSIWGQFDTWMQGAWNSFKTWWESRTVAPWQIKLPHIQVAWEQISGNNPIAKLFGFGALPHLSIAWYAKGGFPEDGLFMANHSELVGKFSNGKTAVANNEQIVEGIRQGVYDAVTAAFSNTNNNGDREVNVKVYLDSREIKTGQNRLNRALGVS